MHKKLETFLFGNKLKEWNNFTQNDIFNLSKFPFLNWIIEQYNKNNVKSSKILKLANAICVAGHINYRVFNCKHKTNIFALAIAPTTYQKTDLQQINLNILKHFNVSNECISRFKSIKYLQAQLLANSGNIMHTDDDLTTFFGNVRPSIASNYLDSLKDDFNILFKSNKKYNFDFLNVLTFNGLDSTFVSLLWSGEKSCLRYLSKHDFANGLMGKFLYFYDSLEIEFDLGLSIEEVQRSIALDIEKLSNIKILKNFGFKFKFSDNAIIQYTKFKEILNEKKNLIREEITFKLMFELCCDHIIKLSIIASNSRIIDAYTINWAIGIVIFSLQSAFLLIKSQDSLNFETNLDKLLFSKIKNLIQESNYGVVTARDLRQSFRKIGKQNVNRSLERLQFQKFIKIKKTTNVGRPSEEITFNDNFLNN